MRYIKLILFISILGVISSCDESGEKVNSEVSYFSCDGLRNFRTTDKDRFSNPHERSERFETYLYVTKKNETYRDRKSLYKPFFLKEKFNVYGSIRLLNSKYEICEDDLNLILFKLSCDQSTQDEMERKEFGESHSFGTLDKLSIFTIYSEEYFDEKNFHQDSWTFKECKKIDRPSL